MSEPLLSPWHIWAILVAIGVVWALIFPNKKGSWLATISSFAPIVIAILWVQGIHTEPEAVSFDFMGAIFVIIALFAVPQACANLVWLIRRKKKSANQK